MIVHTLGLWLRVNQHGRYTSMYLHNDKTPAILSPSNCNCSVYINAMIKIPVFTNGYTLNTRSSIVTPFYKLLQQILWAYHLDVMFRLILLCEQKTFWVNKFMSLNKTHSKTIKLFNVVSAFVIKQCYLLNRVVQTKYYKSLKFDIDIYSQEYDVVTDCINLYPLVFSRLYYRI